MRRLWRGGPGGAGGPGGRGGPGGLRVLAALALLAWASAGLGHVEAYTVDCNAEYADCARELEKISAEDEETSRDDKAEATTLLPTGDNNKLVSKTTPKEKTALPALPKTTPMTLREHTVTVPVPNLVKITTQLQKSLDKIGPNNTPIPSDKAKESILNPMPTEAIKEISVPEQDFDESKDLKYEEMINKDNKELVPKGRRLNISMDELQSFVNTLHNASVEETKAHKKVDLSDVSLDHDDDFDFTQGTDPLKKLEIDKLLNNEDEAFRQINNEVPGHCTENGQSFKIGDKMSKGCEEQCECVKRGVWECVPRCRPPFVRRGRRLPDPHCFETPVDECCSIMACATADVKPATEAQATQSVCKFGNSSYPPGHRWELGCEQVCVCGDDLQVSCKPRCPVVAHSDKCINVKDPKDACCQVQVCDVSQDAHEELDSDSDGSRRRPAQHDVTDASDRIIYNDSDTIEADYRGIFDGIDRVDANINELATTTPTLPNRPLVLAEPISSVKVLPNNTVLVELTHKNSTDDMIHLILSNDGGKTYRDVTLDKLNMLTNLDPGKEYILETKETRTKFNFSIPAVKELEVSDVKVTNTSRKDESLRKVGCYEAGKFYAVGEEFHIGCESVCECVGDGRRDCAALHCPTHVGLELVARGCVRWAPPPPARPPNCCPRAARCLDYGTCNYNGHTIPNWSEVPEELSGCEVRCYCENGVLDCQRICAPLPVQPPPTLRCPPAHKPAPLNVSADDCCKEWGCVPSAKHQKVAITNIVPYSNYGPPLVVWPSENALPSHKAPLFKPLGTLDQTILFTPHVDVNERANSTQMYKVHGKEMLNTLLNYINNSQQLDYERLVDTIKPSYVLTSVAKPVYPTNNQIQVNVNDEKDLNRTVYGNASKIHSGYLIPKPNTTKMLVHSSLDDTQPIFIDETVKNYPENVEILNKSKQVTENDSLISVPAGSIHIHHSFKETVKNKSINTGPLDGKKEIKAKAMLKEEDEKNYSRDNDDDDLPLKSSIDYVISPNDTYDNFSDEPNCQHQTEPTPLKINLLTDENLYYTEKSNQIYAPAISYSNNESEVEKHSPQLGTENEFRPKQSSSYHLLKNDYDRDDDDRYNYKKVSPVLGVYKSASPPRVESQLRQKDSKVQNADITAAYAEPIVEPPSIAVPQLNAYNRWLLANYIYSNSLRNAFNPRYSIFTNPNIHRLADKSRFKVPMVLQRYGTPHTVLKHVSDGSAYYKNLNRKYNNMRGVFAEEYDHNAMKAWERSLKTVDSNEEMEASHSEHVTSVNPPPGFLPTIPPDINFPPDIENYDDLPGKPHNAIRAPPPGLPVFGDKDAEKLTVLSVSADSPTSIKMLFGLPTLLVGLRGHVDLRYTDKEKEDPAYWDSQIFAPADEVLTTARLEFRLGGLQPNTLYRLQGTLVLHDLPIKPRSDVYTAKTLPLVTIAEQEEKREVDSQLAVVEVNDTTAHVTWRHFSPEELRYIDGIQVRYRPVGQPIYSMTEMLHHARTEVVLGELRPGTEYEAALVLVPPVGTRAELSDPAVLHFTTKPTLDPYNWSVAVEAAVQGGGVELRWSGVPSPAERWVRVYRAAHQCGPPGAPGAPGPPATDLFKLTERDQPHAVTFTDLPRNAKCRVWLELFLTNGKVKTSNVLEINTAATSHDAPEHIDNAIEASVRGEGVVTAGPGGGAGAGRGDYYGALVVVGVVAALGALTSLLLLLVVVRRHRPHSMPVTHVPSAPRSTSLPPYDNPAYKLELQQETMNL